MYDSDDNRNGGTNRNSNGNSNSNWNGPSSDGRKPFTHGRRLSKGMHQITATCCWMELDQALSSLSYRAMG